MGSTVENAARDGAEPDDNKVEGDLVWKLKRSAFMRDQSVDPVAAASFLNAMS